MLKAIEVIVKVTERCNLNCSYCYFFNGTNTDFEEHPALIGPRTVTDLASFISEAIGDFGLERVQIDFHGGEPLLLPVRRFDKMCEELRSCVPLHFDLRFAVQTNGTLINKSWIDVFVRHRIHVSFSLDGPEAVNDAARVDHKGRGSYTKTVQGIRQVQDAAHLGDLMPPAVICVASASADGALTYRHFVDDLSITNLHFTLPDFNRDSLGMPSVERYKSFIMGVLDQWLLDDRPDISIRLFKQAMSMMTNGPEVFDLMARSESEFTAFTISSDGSLVPDDDWRNVLGHMFGDKYSVSRSTLREFFSDTEIRSIEREIRTTPSECKSCVWARVCRGGSIANANHRYGRRSSFQRKSIYCNLLLDMHERIAVHAVENGYSPERLEATLVGNLQRSESDFVT